MVRMMEEDGADQLEAHQQAAVEFMWKACYGFVTGVPVDPDRAHGCILIASEDAGRQKTIALFIRTLFGKSDCKV